MESTANISSSTTTKRRGSREDVYTKAQRILSDPARVRASNQASAPDYWVGEVQGDHGSYVVVSVSEHYAKIAGLDNRRLACTCRSGVFAKRVCSHMIVAEEMRLRGEDA
jgi:hypothetical protein